MRLNMPSQRELLILIAILVFLILVTLLGGGGIVMALFWTIVAGAAGLAFIILLRRNPRFRRGVVIAVVALVGAYGLVYFHVTGTIAFAEVWEEPDGQLWARELGSSRYHEITRAEAEAWDNRHGDGFARKIGRGVQMAMGTWPPASEPAD